MAKTDRVRDALDEIVDGDAVEQPEESAPWVQVIFRMAEPDREALRTMFAKDGLSLSAGIRQVLKRYMRGG